LGCRLFGGDLILSGLIDFCFQLLDEYSQTTLIVNESSFSVIELLKTLASKWLSDIVRVGFEGFCWIRTMNGFILVA
jgi:hypothetical protein